MARVTALRAGRRARVVVEVDGAPWRTFPLAVVTRAGLVVGLELDRGRLRQLARERRRARALDEAARVLARRDLSRRSLEARLARASVGSTARADAVETLARVGLVDDGRYARGRAAALADRGFGDAAIRWRLEQEGVDGEAREDAVSHLEPEALRARHLLDRRGRTPSTARLLARRGFSEDAVEWAFGDGAGPRYDDGTSSNI